MSDHEWCKDVARDEAVRRTEDAAAVPAIMHRDLPEIVAELRERVARLEAAQATLGSGDVFRDVGCGSTGDEIARLTAERDAALARVAELEAAAATAANAGGEKQEPVAWGVRRSDGTWWRDCRATRGEMLSVVTGGGDANNVVAPLYAGPPRGWLTAEERGALKRAFDLLCDDDGDQPLAGTVQQLLARSSPPMVKVPHLDDLEADERPVWQSACEAWIAAIREAGGEVEG